MIFLKPQLFEPLGSPAAPGRLDGLKTALQQAIMLEHATIPPYLYALYSIKTGANARIRALLRSVVMEEMLHLSLSCNILNAIGGAPVLDDPAFVPPYPGPLPGAVDDQLIVPLACFSLNLVKNVFMVIEEPEQPLNFPVEALAIAAPLTIGQFYRAIKGQIVQLGKGIFVGDPAKQLTEGFPSTELIKVTSVDSAVKAIEIIIEQGEGTSELPLDLEDELAHYYRFAEIAHGKELVKNPHAPPNAPNDQKFIYDGPAIPFDPEGVLPVIENPRAAAYPTDSRARHACDTFNYTYTSLLKALHRTFNGAPDQLGTAIGLMESLKAQAMDLMQIDLGNKTTAGPSFEYQPVNP